MKGPTTFRAFSAKEDFQLVPPGPMAQAFTFRAFGAETRSSPTLSTAPGSDTASRVAYPLFVQAQLETHFQVLCNPYAEFKKSVSVA